MIYINIFHTKNNIKLYLKTLEKVFSDISKKKINKLPKSQICFKPIKKKN